MDNITQTIRQRRMELGLTQEQLAEKLHVSRQTVSHWETGRVMPDMQSLLQLAEVLECQFSIGVGEPLREKPCPMNAQEEKPGDDNAVPKARKRKLWLALALFAAAVLLAVAAGVSSWHALHPAMAEILVTPQDGEAYMIVNDHFPNGGWDVPFYFENVSDVPFRLEYLEARYYAGETLSYVLMVPAEQVWPHMSSEWMQKGDFPLCWPFGSNQHSTTHFECIIVGTDANGNHLRFSGSVRYLPETAE